MAAYRRVYDSHHLQADCKEPGSTPEPYLGNRLWATQYLYFLGKGDAKIRILKLTRQGHRLAGWSLVVYDCQSWGQKLSYRTGTVRRRKSQSRQYCNKQHLERLA